MWKMNACVQWLFRSLLVHLQAWQLSGVIPVCKKALSISSGHSALRVGSCLSLTGFHSSSINSAGTGNTSSGFHEKQSNRRFFFERSLVNNTHMAHSYTQSVPSVIIMRVVSRLLSGPSLFAGIVMAHCVAFSYIKLFQISRFLCTALSYILCKQAGTRRTVRFRQASIG